MATDKSLRQHYDKGKIVDSFREGLETIAGKAVDMTSKFAPKTKEEKTGTFDLGSTVKSYAKDAIKTKIQNAVLNKLGLSFLNPYMGLASLFGFDFTKGFAPGMKEPGQTQAQYEAARAARQTQARIDNMLDRKAAGKTYSQKVLNELTIGSRPGFYGNVPTVSRVNIAKNLIGMPENLGDRGSISPPPTGLVNPIQQARDAQAAKDAKDAKDAAAAAAAAKAAAKQAVDRHRGNGGGQGQQGGGGGPPGGEGGWKGAKGGYVDRPLPGRNRYL